MADSARKSDDEGVVSGEHPVDLGERRRLARVQTEFAVVIELPDGQRFDARALDVGVGGLFLETTQAPGYGSSLTAILTEGSATLRFPAIVRWANERGIGLQFGLLGARETHFLSRICSRVRDSKPAL
jgi:type IV pilus assembly protein PilZ